MTIENVIKISDIDTYTQTISKVDGSLGPRAATFQKAIRPQLLIMLHGIRTNAEWMDDIIKEGIVGGLFKAEPVSYGNFGTLSFLYRDIEMSLYVSLIEQIEDLANKYVGYDISIMCHSFGTKLFSDICRFVNVDFKFVFFMGGVAKVDWSQHVSKKCLKLINDCSRRDKWPRVASAFNSKRYEATGVYGFHRNWAQDRVFDCLHSDYLTRHHFNKYVLPAIISNTIIYPV